MEHSILLENIALSSLSPEALVSLQSSVRAAVANVSSIPVDYISVPVLTSSAQPSPAASPLVKKFKIAAKSAEGILAHYSIIGLSSVILSALNVSTEDSKNGSVLAAICSSRLNVNNGSVLLNAIRVQASSSSSSLLLSSLLLNATISKVTVTVVPVAAPSVSPTVAPSPTSAGASSSSNSDQVGLYIGIAVGIFVAFLAIAGLYFLWMKYSRQSTKVIAIQKEPETPDRVVIPVNEGVAV